jgi:lipoyl(octanoyl) transferase
MKTAWLPCPADYEQVWRDMQQFTAGRDAATPDEIWLCEHAPVYTLGQAGRREHLLNAGAIAVVQSDRGGQVTYHGPGQVVAYALVDLRRGALFVREYVALLEDAALDCLSELGVAGACRKAGAPGIYVADPAAADGSLAKVAALGVKIRNGRAYHGIALNVAMDLAPFSGIDPCGYAGLKTLDLAALGISADLRDAGDRLAARIAARIPAPLSGAEN